MEIDDEMRRNLIDILKYYEDLLNDKGVEQEYEDKAEELKWRLENETRIRQS